MDDILAKYRTTIKQKKRKIKGISISIIDDEVECFNPVKEDDSPLIVLEKPTNFIFKKTQTWSQVEGPRRAPSRSPSPSPTNTPQPTEQHRRIPRSPSEKSLSPVLKGLLSPSAFKRDQAKRHKHELGPASVEGKDVQTIHRNKTGKKINIKEENEKLVNEKLIKDQTEIAKMKWGQGLVQNNDIASKAIKLKSQTDQPFSNYTDDYQLNSELKNTRRWGDPISLLNHHHQTNQINSSNTKMYTGNIPINRFNVRPGYRWDGVERGNGFEKKFIEYQNEQTVFKENFHKWSTEDM
jgi:pre-mRNA-splicing factor CWC26